MKVKNVLTKKEKRQETLTRKSMIGQLSTTGREGSTQNITREEVFIRYGKKNGKKAPKQRFVILGEVIKVGKNEDMYKIKFTSPVSQVSKSEWSSIEDIADFKKKLEDNKHDLKRRKQEYQKSLLIPLTTEDRLTAFLTAFDYSV